MGAKPLTASDNRLRTTAFAQSRHVFGHSGSAREISVRSRMRGGTKRTRTWNQQEARFVCATIQLGLMPRFPAEEKSLSVKSPPVKSALEDLPAQIEGDTEKTTSSLSRLISNSAEKLEGLIVELQEMLEFLRSEGERVQREIVNYAQLHQSVASAATKIKTETVGTWKITGEAQHSAARPLNGREKLKRWPA
jgi:hypothetical protein